MLHFQTSNRLSNRSISLCCGAFRKLWVLFFLLKDVGDVLGGKRKTRGERGASLAAPASSSCSASSRDKLGAPGAAWAAQGSP